MAKNSSTEEIRGLNQKVEEYFRSSAAKAIELWVPSKGALLAVRDYNKGRKDFSYSSPTSVFEEGYVTVTRRVSQNAGL